MKKMHIRIKRDGKTEIRVEGGQNEDCLEFTRGVEESLGIVETREMFDGETGLLEVKISEQITEMER